MRNTINKGRVDTLGADFNEKPFKLDLDNMDIAFVSLMGTINTLSIGKITINGSIFGGVHKKNSVTVTEVNKESSQRTIRFVALIALFDKAPGLLSNYCRTSNLIRSAFNWEWRKMEVKRELNLRSINATLT